MSRLHLYAVVRASERKRVKRVRSVVGGELAALVGKAGAEGRAAVLRHHRVVEAAMEACSSVVPFRFGVEAPSEEELAATLAGNAAALEAQLARFREKVEMGLRILLTDPEAVARASASDGGGWLRAAIFPVRALAPRGADRQEKRRLVERGLVFEGCYLIPRDAVERYFAAADKIREMAPGAPVLATGPWAPYSFTDLTLAPPRDGVGVGLAG